MEDMRQDMETILFDQAQLEAKVAQLGEQISQGTMKERTCSWWGCSRDRWCLWPT